MNRENLNEYWTRFLDDESSPETDRWLEQAMNDDESLRELLLNDAGMDGMLTALARSDSGADAFVEEIISRLAESADDVPVFPSPRISASTTVEPPPIITAEDTGLKPPPIPPPVSVRPTSPAQDAPSSITGSTTSSRVGRRERWILAACAAALLAIASVGVILLYSLNGSPPVADDRDPAAPTDSASTERNLPETPKRPSNDANEMGDRPIVAPVPKVVDKPRDPSPELNDTRKPDDSPAIVETPSAPPTTNEQPVQPPKIVEQPAPPPAPFGTIVSDTDAIWDSQTPATLSGAPLRLQSGTVEIVMAGGASLTVRGPAVFGLVSANSIALNRGRVAATVPREAHGFTVKTPSSQVVDLGTEFVVDVDDARATAVHVLRGEVEVSTTKKEEDAEQRWRLGAGQYKWVSADGATSFDWRMQLTVDEKSFAGRLNVNGEEVAFAKPADFIPLFTKMTQEVGELGQLLSVTRRPRGAEPFRAVIDINGERSTITNTTEYQRALRRVTEQLRQLYAAALQSGAAAPGGVFNGSFNFNGEEFRINSFDDLLKLQEEIKRRATGDLKPVAPDRGEKKPDELLPAKPLKEPEAKLRDGEARRKTKNLFGIEWHESPEHACAVAETAKGKPVMWFRVLGDLDGFM